MNPQSQVPRLICPLFRQASSPSQATKAQARPPCCAASARLPPPFGSTCPCPGRTSRRRSKCGTRCGSGVRFGTCKLQQDLIEALDLHSHLGKKLSMLSAGSRRKVALVGLLASGATVTCLDQPFAALDAPSARVIRDFLADMADHTTRTWVVADYEADARLPWRRHVVLQSTR